MQGSRRLLVADQSRDHKRGQRCPLSEAKRTWARRPVSTWRESNEHTPTGSDHPSTDKLAANFGLPRRSFCFLLAFSMAPEGFKSPEGSNFANRGEYSHLLRFEF